MTDYDSPWKEAISLYFQDFLRFFFPSIEAGINWQHGFEFLDTELQQIKRETKTGRREADKLVKVWRQNGEETWVLVHIEVQSQQQSEFAERMYLYNGRIFDTYRRPVVSLGVLADEQPSWRPNCYERELWGCRSRLEFPIVKLLDYNEKELADNPNPFAAIVQAHRAAQRMSQNPQSGYENKLALVKSLYQRGLSRQDIVELFRLIDWLIALPRTEERRLWKEMESLEKEREMPYITSVERFGIEKGRQEGLQEGQITKGQRDILRILEVRFEEIPAQLRERVGAVKDLEVLEMLLVQAVTTQSLDVFESVLSAEVETLESDAEPTELEKRFQEGQRRQRQEDLLRILEVRFGEIAVELRERIGQIGDLEVLGMLLIQAVIAESLEEWKSSARQS
ncbi:transposase [Oscillatoria sp. FACHB-1406]|uniref:transposase n=1 Tax=Oscillatoria sp. FACHB-1406 TaxID=2692846 RepID=UPI0018F00BB2|nr:transposase [Oscillatoria sp. FACHB-1406]